MSVLGGGEQRRGTFAGRVYSGGDPLPTNAAWTRQALGSPALPSGLRPVLVGQEDRSWTGQSGDPTRGSGERTGLQETPLLPGAGAEAQTGFVQSHEGLARGNCARAELSHKPQFLSVVLKESVESADWAVLRHPRTERLRLLAGRGEKPR